MIQLLISLRSSVVFFLALLVLLVIFSIIIVYSLSVTLYVHLTSKTPLTVKPFYHQT